MSDANASWEIMRLHTTSYWATCRTAGKLF